MIRFGLLVSASVLALACGGSTSGSGGTDGGAGATGGTGGAGGATGGTGGATGGTGGATGGTGGTGGATGGTGGGTGGATGGTGGATGGTGGTGGATGGTGGTGGSGGAQPECTSDGDCTLFNDCCTCEGLAPGEPQPPACPNTCIQSSCAAHGITQARCVAGRCVAGFACDDSKVACASPSPLCPAGTVPEIKGNCFTGQCVDAAECLSVANCTRCTGANQACAAYETQLGPEAHCVSVPSVCNGDASCACLGPSVCTGGFNVCGDFSGVKGVMCSCPAC